MTLAVLKTALPPQALIFDIGRVIVRIDPERVFTPIAAALKNSAIPDNQDKPMPDQIWTMIQSDPRWRDWQEGRMTPQQWHQHITGRLRIPLSFADFCAAWNRALDPQPIFDDELFAKLGTRCRLGLLSNTDPLHSEYLEQHFSFIRHFPARIYSCGVGASKPAAAIYQAVLRAVDVPATAALYIDDVAEYAEAARQLGLDAICFEGPAQLTRELSRRGISI